MQQGDADSAMCSYSLSTAPTPARTGRCRTPSSSGDMGFTGFVTSDWGATHSTVASANNGLDMEMPGSTLLRHGADDRGEQRPGPAGHHQRPRAPDPRHDVHRRGLFDHAQRPATRARSSPPAAHAAVAKQVARRAACCSRTPGRYCRSARPHSIAVIGDDAGPNAMTQGGGSAWVNPPYRESRRYQGIKARGRQRRYRHLRPGHRPADRPAYLTRHRPGAGLPASTTITRPSPVRR